MAGKPFKVGRFAHTLRVRLMREHAGVDVDAMEEEDLMANSPTKPEHEQEPWDPENEQEQGKENGITHVGHKERRTAATALFSDGANAFREGSSPDDLLTVSSQFIVSETGCGGRRLQGCSYAIPRDWSE
jgi:hypothetical protein